MTFKIPTGNDAPADTRPIFEMLIAGGGKVSNLYAMLGYSGNALSSYLAFVKAQAKGSFHAKDREAIFLIVSEFNGCDYCLAAHTQTALKFGWTEEETLALRAGTFPELKWQIMYRIIHSVIAHKGEVGDDILHSFFGAGFREQALVDLLVLINIMTFTNYLYRLTKVPIDFPAAKLIE